MFAVLLTQTIVILKSLQAPATNGCLAMVTLMKMRKNSARRKARKGEKSNNKGLLTQMMTATKISRWHALATKPFQLKTTCLSEPRLILMMFHWQNCSTPRLLQKLLRRKNWKSLQPCLSNHCGGRSTVHPTRAHCFQRRTGSTTTRWGCQNALSVFYNAYYWWDVAESWRRKQ